MTPEEKLNICKKCEFYGISPLKIYKDLCQKCGCYMPIKVKISLFKCPENKWD